MKKQDIHVLLIEDDAGDAFLVKTALKQTKEIEFEVTWVESLNLAKSKLAYTNFDVILLDLSLPDSQGLATVEIARQMVSDIPIVVLTGHGDTEFALTALKAGANDYMVKGDFGFGGVARVIRYALLRAEMETENKLLVAALNAAANGIVITDKNAVIKWANAAFSTLTGYSLEEALNHRPSELVKSDIQSKAFYIEMWRKLLTGQQWHGEIINKNKNGEFYHEELSIAPVKNNHGEIVNFIGIKQDITKRKALEEMLQKLANTDPLTGLFNRRVFLDRLSQESDRVARLGGTATLLMLDLDFFKHINDSYGHNVGDEVLQKFAKIVREHSRNIDIAARIGGEEFTLLLPNSGQDNSTIMAERLRKEVEHLLIETPKGNVTVTVSIGAALLDASNLDGELTLNRADSALYTAKESGRNRLCWFEA